MSSSPFRLRDGQRGATFAPRASVRSLERSAKGVPRGSSVRGRGRVRSPRRRTSRRGASSARSARAGLFAETHTLSFSPGPLSLYTSPARNPYWTDTARSNAFEPLLSSNLSPVPSSAHQRPRAQRRTRFPRFAHELLPRPPQSKTSALPDPRSLGEFARRHSSPQSLCRCRSDQSVLSCFALAPLVLRPEFHWQGIVSSRFSRFASHSTHRCPTPCVAKHLVCESHSRSTCQDAKYRPEAEY